MAPAWDARTGTAGGDAFAEGLRTMMADRELDEAGLAAAADLPSALLAATLAGEERVGVSTLARLAAALRVRAIEFLQRANVLSLAAYAAGLDPLFFLPEGQVRFDARIYMREINPRYAVPEGDMTKRNPTLVAIAQDELLDGVGKLELELAYLLRTAVQAAGPAL
ncbi:MAG TPA: helix-turn-helix transcriptional regulator [Candidatus Dormibacteraeota bacterium]|nr:helix-turn-helix transcriptional regulator [Candidatus Dormibacteraeota bacterium]